MKIQPNFSWQKYEGKPEDQKEQFQYQLQQQHIQVSNAVNATIDDESFFARERQTAFTWVDERSIYTKSLATVTWTVGNTVNVIPHGITGTFVVIDMVCCLSNGTLRKTLPYLDPAYGTDSVSILADATNVTLTSAGANYSAYSGYVTIYYVKI